MNILSRYAPSLFPETYTAATRAYSQTPDPLSTITGAVERLHQIDRLRREYRDSELDTEETEHCISIEKSFHKLIKRLPEVSLSPDAANRIYDLYDTLRKINRSELEGQANIYSSPSDLLRVRREIYDLLADELHKVNQHHRE
jgi:hypothetical protein